jgi:hypothetical protein
MVNKDKKILFIAVCDFLRENKILEKYCYNAAVYHGIKFPEDARPVDKTKITFGALIRYVNPFDSYQVDEFISRFDTAFDWMETPEGHNFWDEISNKWRKEHTLYIKKYENMRDI